MKKILIFTTPILSLVSSLFAGGNEYVTAEIYDSLRKQVLSLTPEQLGEYGNGPVFCVTMETGYPEAIATVVAVADGSASLYFSNGGGIIGTGEHSEGRAAALSVVDYSERFLKHTKSKKIFPLPRKGDKQNKADEPDGKNYAVLRKMTC